MSSTTRRLMTGLGLGSLVAALVAAPTMAASAATAGGQTCTGTAKAPGVLTGTYPGNVTVSGVCAVNAGPTVIKGNLTVAPGGGVLAVFALNDQTHTGFSSLTVNKNVVVKRGAAVALGCEANAFPCADDTGKPPTLNSRVTIGGSLFATDALGVLVHNTSISGAVSQQGGGGGVSCTPKGVFKLFKSPVYSDYEDNVVGDSLIVSGLHSCWFGALRNSVHGSIIVTTNTMADPDANELGANYANRSLTCRGNNPAIQYGDSGSTPTVVNGKASGQCRFSRQVPNPPPNGPLMPIAVRSVP